MEVQPTAPIFLLKMKNKILKEKLTAINDAVIFYPTPYNLSYYWGFGSLAGVCLIIQILTGVLLTMHYTPNITYAFISVEHIMRDVNYGWLLRYAHANGASMFFIVVYIHIFRGLYYGSYNKPRQLVWVVGILIFILMMATAFMGYVLPWGQMSFWGATVITNLFSAIPFIGNDLVQWLWGGFSVDNATLNRFFSLHYFLPFLIAAFSTIHLIILHQFGSTNPLGIISSKDNIPFYPYFIFKDIFGLFLFFIFFSYFLFFNPNLLGHPDNYIPANPLVTPPHIVPEWYFLPFYAILRAIPNKLGGVIFMGLAIIILLILPFLASNSSIRSSAFRPFYKFFNWCFAINFLLLGWLGAQPIEDPYIIIGIISTFLYFFFLLVNIFPLKSV